MMVNADNDESHDDVITKEAKNNTSHDNRTPTEGQNIKKKYIVHK